MTLRLLTLLFLSLALPLAGCGDGALAGTDDHADHGEDHDDHGDGHGDDHADEGHADEVALTADAIARYGVAVGTVEARSLEAAVTAPARVAFDEEATAHVSSLVRGRVQQIDAALGDVVEAGDLLFVVESPELGQRQAEYLATLASVEAARPAVELARGSFDRATSLYDQTEGGGVTLNTVRDREAELRAAEREFAAAENAAASAANTLRLYGMDDAGLATLAESKAIDPTFDVVAPIDGEIVERHATLGELVGPDDEALMTLADLSSVWVLIDLPESRLASIGVGASASIEVPALGGRTFEGEVRYVDPRVNASTRTIRLRVVVENESSALQPGLFARATIVPAESGEPTAALPAAAVLEVEGEPSVFVPVADEADTFARRAVVVGERVGGFFPVLSGVAVGDEVVVDGAFILKAEIEKAGVEHSH